MQWESLTSSDFKKAVKKTNVCIIAMGVVEKHGEHLPLGTDFLNGHKLACQAAEKEPAIVFPPFYFGQIYEARCFPGTIAVKPTLLMDLVQSVFDEIGRNGIEKIVIWSAHGGNNHFIPFLQQCQLWSKKPYSLYWVPRSTVIQKRLKEWTAITGSPAFDHGCVLESSLSRANHDQWVKMDRLPNKKSNPLGRLDHLPPFFTGISWYADYPEHYQGDGRPATVEKGRLVREIIADGLAEFIADVKKDKVVPLLEKEFHSRVESIRNKKQK